MVLPAPGLYAASRGAAGRQLRLLVPALPSGAQEDLAATIEQVGGEEAFDIWLKSMCLTAQGFEDISAVSYINNRMAEGMFRDGTDQAPTAEDLRSYAQENDILAAKHILLMTVDAATREPLPKEEIDQKRATAEDLLAQLQAIADPAEQAAKFDELMNQYSEDTGLATNPDGYVFTSGEMVEPFEEGTRALDYGQISGIVESDYGFHIILRLDPAEDETIRSDWQFSQLNELSTQWVDEAEIVTTETYDNLDVGDFYDKLTEKGLAEVWTGRQAMDGSDIVIGPVIAAKVMAQVAESKRRGLARAVVLRALHSYPPQRRALPVWLGTQTWSHDAILLYDSLGFCLVREGLHPAAHEPNCFAEGMEVLRAVYPPEVFSRLLAHSLPT